MLDNLDNHVLQHNNPVNTSFGRRCSVARTDEESADDIIARAKALKARFKPEIKTLVFIEPAEPVVYSYPKRPRILVKPTNDREAILPVVTLISLHHDVPVAGIFKGHEDARKAREEAVYYVARTNPSWSIERLAKAFGVAPRTVRYILGERGVTMCSLRASMIRTHREAIKSERANREAASSDNDEARRIVKSVAALHGVKISELMADNRMAHVSAARHAAVGAVAESFPEWTLHRLGRFFGRDHSTIVNSLKVAGVRRVQA